MTVKTSDKCLRLLNIIIIIILILKYEIRPPGIIFRKPIKAWQFRE